MQDNMIQGLMHKFNNRGISYSIDKCHLIYEKSLQSKQETRGFNVQSNFGLINQLFHERILNVQSFDPCPLIERKFLKTDETMFDVKNLEKQKTNKHHLNIYQEFMNDL